MGSAFKKHKDIFITLPNPNAPGQDIKRKIPFYMQFTPGFVQEVVTAQTSLMSKGKEHNQNSIIAMPHITSDSDLQTRRSHIEESRRYIPLFRGMVDVPTKGDPVLLCSIGGQNYYLGPLNTQNNVNFNEDALIKPEIDFTPHINNAEKQSGNTQKGQSPNFIKVPFKRLSKPASLVRDGALAYNETHGDMMFEGRHGNSIRIGSRNVNPYMLLSNNRHPDNVLESLTDGSLITMTSNGGLGSHLGSIKIQRNEKNETTEKILSGFRLSADNLEVPNRIMSNLIKSVHGKEEYKNTNTYINDQILIHSNRITINSKVDDIYLSSIKDIHIGTGRHLTISTNEDIITESQRTFLGDPKKGKQDGESRQFEPMVLGNILTEILTDLLAALKGAKGICQGTGIPLVDETGAPTALFSNKIGPIETKLKKLLSIYHFIEPNDAK